MLITGLPTSAAPYTSAPGATSCASIQVNASDQGRCGFWRSIARPLAERRGATAHAFEPRSVDGGAPAAGAAAGGAGGGPAARPAHRPAAAPVPCRVVRKKDVYTRAMCACTSAPVTGSTASTESAMRSGWARAYAVIPAAKAST
jgi:hypothetical protein